MILLAPLASYMWVKVSSQSIHVATAHHKLDGGLAAGKAVWLKFGVLGEQKGLHS